MHRLENAPMRILLCGGCSAVLLRTRLLRVVGLFLSLSFSFLRDRSALDGWFRGDRCFQSSDKTLDELGLSVKCPFLDGACILLVSLVINDFQVSTTYLSTSSSRSTQWCSWRPVLWSFRVPT